jgi:membrane fusion protein (multidrug efflux system)
MNSTFARLAVILILAAAGGGAWWHFRARSTKPEASAQPGRAGAGPVVVDVIAAARAPLRETISAVGTLRANESVQIVSELSRRLVRVAVEEGADVQAGDLLFKLDDTDLAAELGEIEARLRLAVVSEKRTRELLERKAASQQDYDRDRAALEQIEAECTVKRALIAKTEIRAPFRGRVGIRRVSEGAWVTPATVLTALQDLSRIKVDFQLPERYGAAVRTGQSFTFSVTGISNGFTGAVTVIEPEVDGATRSVQVRGLCSSPDPRLRPGGFAAVTLQLDLGGDGFAVPAEAVVPTVRGHGVYVARNGVAEMVNVEIGARTPSHVRVVRGLSEGDAVILTNLLRLRPGAAVRVNTTPGTSAAR